MASIEAHAAWAFITIEPTADTSAGQWGNVVFRKIAPAWPKSPSIVAPARVLNGLAAALAAGALSACGDNRDAPAAPAMQESLLAQRVVAVSAIPDLYRCLSDLGAALQKDAGFGTVDLACATGTYRGATSAGRHCELKIDGPARVFRFEIEHDIVSIRIEPVAHAADGRPLHNLADASAPAQPGIQLTRFSGAPVPVTEALILRFGSGLPALPQMIYQRTATGPPETVLCSFGK
jgi:hypothetical protein